MENTREILFLLIGFLIVSVAANHIARLFRRVRLPLITGLLVIGIIVGPDILGLIPDEGVEKLKFVNDLALAFIAFAVGSELYLRELRDHLKSITWMTVGQMVVTFFLGGAGVFFLMNYIPFSETISLEAKITISILAGTIFVARSPASAIAIINELRARGPFTRTVLGVTVLIDFAVIILFAVAFTIGETLVIGVDFSFIFLIILFIEILVAFLLGYLLGKLLGVILSRKVWSPLKKGLILLVGFGVFELTYFLRDWSYEVLALKIYMEPLLICIIGSFVVTNYSKYRSEFLKLMHEVGPLVYVVFFTLVGASVALDYLTGVWFITLALFCVRLISMVIGGFTGGILAHDPMRFNRVAWMPYVTQAGVSLGLTTIVASEFAGWGQEFATIMIAVIFLNQIIGPPLLRYSIIKVREHHPRVDIPFVEGDRDVIIFGLENQSIALARQLTKNGWQVKIATFLDHYDEKNISDIQIVRITELDTGAFELLEAEGAEAMVLMLSDEENLKICEHAYENYGTREMVVRLHDRSNFTKFHELGAKIVEPSTAIVSLLDHFVRSPQATSLLLGMQEDQDTLEVEVQNPNFHGIALRNLRLPSDVIILSVTRSDHMIISHGYTRLRMGDIITLVGSSKSLENVRIRFEK